MQRKNNTISTHLIGTSEQGERCWGMGRRQFLNLLVYFFFFWHNSGIHVWQAFKLLTIFNPFEYPPYKQKLEKIKTEFLICKIYYLAIRGFCKIKTPFSIKV